MDVKLPQLAEGVESGTVVSILVSEGNRISKDQPFMELETQKAVGSIPSPASGVVRKIHVKEGMEVSVGQVLITVSTEAPASATQSETVIEKKIGGDSVQAQHSVAARQPIAAQTRPEIGGPQPQVAPPDYRYESKHGAPPPASPAIRKIARELDIDLTRVRGSQRGGRIVLEDLRNYIRELQRFAFQKQPAPAPTTPLRPQEIPDFSKWGPVRREKMSPLRRTVSQRMLESWSSIPKINQFDDADITQLSALRKKYAGAYEKKGSHLTLTALIVRVLANVLPKHPRVNASLDESTQEIIYKDYFHIGIAVATEAGLIVPVLRNIDKKNVLELSLALHDLTEKTRARKISVEELQGGTFTISNQGSIGSSHFTPIIYAPQVAILGIGQGKAKPVVVEDKVTIRTILPLCLAYDHRVLDGADAVRFLKDLIRGLETVAEAEVRLK